MTLELGKSGIPLGAYEEGAGSGGGGGASELDQYLSGSTNASTTTLTVKDGKALDISAPTIAVGDNLVNNINGENSQLYLKQGDIEPGDNITVEQTSTGVKVSATGGAAPTNMVTTDTDQTITGNKTFTGNQGINVGSINTHTNISEGGLNIVNSNTSVLDITSSGTYAMGYSTRIKGYKDIIITNSHSDGKIIVSPYSRALNAFKYMSGFVLSAPTYDILHSGNLVAGSGVTISDPDNIGVRTISASGGSTPENMVTTDTDQTITGSKTFKHGNGISVTGTSSNSNAIKVDGDDKTILFNSINATDALIKNSGYTATKLKIGDNFERVQITTNLYDKDGTLITGGSGGSGSVEAKIAALTERVAALEAQIGGGSTPTVTFSSQGSTVKSGAAQSTTILQAEQIGSVDFVVSGSTTVQE